MEHFSEQVWADFARGFHASEKAQDIKAHIAAGCMDCKVEHSFWGRLQAMAQAECAYNAPENLVRLAKLEFTAEREFHAEEWSLANLLFDSLAQPLLAGVRSGGAIARQVVYEAEGLTVDLRFDRVVPSGTVAAVGQILDSCSPHELLAGSPVVIWTASGQLVATTTANSYGEFQLEFEARDDLRLVARVGTRRLRMPLTNLK
ncbi:MAG: hypothetical protein WCB53_22215 [Terriglobales bacterium]